MGIENSAENQMAFIVRAAVPQDAKALLGLMQALAKFEGYDANFRVTESDLLERGLATASPQFVAFVAEQADGELSGYAVVYQINFTYDLRPTLHLKELFVNENARQSGAGKALMHAVIAHAKANGCGRLKWDVLPDNAPAKKFYRRFNAHPVCDWEAWICDF
jgi:ribosomal protein S18 acetylase RimI-like enzyme